MVQLVQPYSCTDTATVWKKSCFISSWRGTVVELFTHSCEDNELSKCISSKVNVIALLGFELVLYDYWIAVEVMKAKLLYKNIYVFFFIRKGLNFFDVWDRQRKGGKTDYDNASLPGMLNRKPLRASALNGSLSLTTGWLCLRSSLTPTDSAVAGICIYYFITPTHFRLDHMIFFRLFTQVYLWLMAQSRVNKKNDVQSGMLAMCNSHHKDSSSW